MRPLIVVVSDSAKLCGPPWPYVVSRSLPSLPSTRVSSLLTTLSGVLNAPVPGVRIRRVVVLTDTGAEARVTVGAAPVGPPVTVIPSRTAWSPAPPNALAEADGVPDPVGLGEPEVPLHAPRAPPARTVAASTAATWAGRWCDTGDPRAAGRSAGECRAADEPGHPTPVACARVARAVPADERVTWRR